MSGSLLPNVDGQFFDNNGLPLASGKLYFYEAGTTTPKDVYSDFSAGTPLANPVILDSSGRAQVWGIGSYKIVIATSADVIIKTVDDVFMNGAVADIVGGFHVDHTTGPQPYPVVFEHSNVFSNLDTYGSGTVTIKSTGQNNNQPLLYLSKVIDTSSLGNGANLILANSGGSTKTTSSIFAVDLEMVANNSLINSTNGKFEVGALSSFTVDGSGESGGGLWYLAPRRADATGFERMIDIFQLSHGGRIYHRGEGITIKPLYDPSVQVYSADRAFLDITADYSNAEINCVSNKVGGNAVVTINSGSTGYARIETVGNTDSYTRIKSEAGTATEYIEAQTANKNATLELRSNWTTPGTGSSIINLYNDNSAGTDGWRIQSNGTNARLNFRVVVAGTTYENVDIDPVQDGMVSIYRNSDYTKGRIKLSTGGGAAGGGTIEYDSNTGDLAIAADSVTLNSGKLVQVAHTLVATVAAGTSTIAPTALDYSFICNTGALMATYTFNLPAAPADNQIVRILNRAGITAPTFVGGGGATIYNPPASLAAGTPVAWIYCSAPNVWYRIV